jgi:transposase
VACIQKEEETRSVKDFRPLIKKIPDELWNEIKKVLPEEKHPKQLVDRPIIPYRKLLDRILLYVLRTLGCQWKMLPKEHGSGSTCHR